jgi:hypothetical protein
MSTSLNQKKPVTVKPIFKKSNFDDFSKTIVLRVENYFKETGKSKNGGWEATLKTIFLLTLFCILYGLLLSNW